MKRTVKLGSYDLRFDYNALCIIEGQTGPNIWLELEAGTFTPSFRIIRAILWGGLNRADGTITLERAGDIIGELLDTMTIIELSDKLLEGLDSAFPDAEDVEANGGGEPGKKKAG